MKLCLAGDAHGNLQFMESVIRKAKTTGCDAVIQLGDFGVAWPGDRMEFPAGVSNCAVENDIPVYFCKGNHDGHHFLDGLVEDHGWAEPIAVFNKANNLFFLPNGCRIKFGQDTFGILGGAFSIDHKWRTDGVDWWAASERPSEEDVERLGAEPVDVLLTHDSPELPDAGHWLNLNTVDEYHAEMSRRMVRSAIRNTKPKYVFHGHLHYYYEMMTNGGYLYYDENGEERSTNMIGLDCDSAPFSRAVIIYNTRSELVNRWGTVSAQGTIKRLAEDRTYSKDYDGSVER